MRPMMAAEQSGEKERPRPAASAGSAGPALAPPPAATANQRRLPERRARALSPPARFLPPEPGTRWVLFAE